MSHNASKVTSSNEKSLLGAEAVASRLGTHRHALPRLINAGIVPPPDETNPQRWKEQKIRDCKIPTPEIAAKELNAIRAGKWRAIGPDVRTARVNKWKRAGLLAQDDFAKKLVMSKGALCELTFVCDPHGRVEGELTAREAAKS